MDHSGTNSANLLGLFSSEGEWTRSQVLEAQPVETFDFGIEAFEQFRTIRLLTCSPNVPMFHTVLERFAESEIECVLRYV